MPAKDKPPVSMRIRLKYPDVETFVDKYSANISEGGMFIQSRAPQPVGTALRFDLMLQDGTPLLKGEGIVIWVKEYDVAHPGRVHGMGVRFRDLDDASRSMVSRVVARKSAEVEHRQLSHTQEVRALEAQASTEPDEPDATDVPDPPGAAAGGKEQATLFAALLDEAKREQEKVSSAPLISELVSPASVAGAPSHAIDGAAAPWPRSGNPEAVQLPEAAAGVSEALDMAEQVLTQLLQQSGVADEQLQRAWQWASLISADDAEAQLEALLATTGVPPSSIDDVLAAPAPIATLATAPSPEAATAAPFDPTLLQAAARTARASKQVSGRAFDLTEGVVAQAQLSGTFESLAPAVESAAPVESPAAPPDQAAPDPGWTNLQTSTELLDHHSSDVLRDLAQRSAEHALEEPVEPPATSAQEAEEEHAQDDATAPAATEQPATVPVLEPPAADDELDLEPPPAASEPSPEPVAASEDELDLEPTPAPEGDRPRRESAELLSRAVWRDVVSEAAESLDDDGAAGPAQDLSEPRAQLDATSAEDDEEALELDALEIMDVTDGADSVEEAPAPQVGSAEAGALFSEADLQAIDLFGEAEEDSTMITDAPTFGVSSGSRPTPVRPYPRVREASAKDPDEPARARRDPLADIESEPFDRANETLRSDPALENEFFEALGELPETPSQHDGDDAAPSSRAPDRESNLVPELDDLVTSVDAVPDAQVTARPDSSASAPADGLELIGDDAELDDLQGGPGELDGAKKQLRPRRSGLLKRLFGKNKP